MSSLIPFLVSLLLGFLIGIEREKSGHDDAALGVRTFTLIALLGSISGWMEELWLSIALAVFALGLVLISYQRSSTKRGNRGLTTEFAAGIVFALGHVAHRDSALVALLGCVVALLLFWKAPLHRFSAKVRPRELEAGLLILLVGISVLSVVPNEAIDPWGLLNPRTFGLVVLIVAAIEFTSYVTVKFLGRGTSAVLVGFLGGLASSTSVMLAAAHAMRADRANGRAWTVTVTAASISSILELVVIVGIVAHELLPRLVLVVSGFFLIGLIAIFLLLRAENSAELSFELDKPLDIFSVLRLSLLLSGILGLVTLAQQYAGDLGRYAVAFISGLFEMHGVSFATATLYAQNHLTSATAFSTIEIAILASLLAKIGILWIFGRGIFRWVLTGIFLGMGAALVAASRLSALGFASVGA